MTLHEPPGDRDRPDGPNPFDGLGESRTRDDLPEGIDPLGVPPPGSGRDTFIVLLAVVAALLALIFTLGWVVYHHLLVSSGSAGFAG